MSNHTRPFHQADTFSNKSLTLQEAVHHFMGDPPQHQISDADAKARSLAMLAYLEGAAWACWRIYHEYLQDKPEPLKAVIAILEQRALLCDQAGIPAPPKSH